MSTTRSSICLVGYALLHSVNSSGSDLSAVIGSIESGNSSLVSVKLRKFLDQEATVKFSKMGIPRRVTSFLVFHTLQFSVCLINSELHYDVVLESGCIVATVLTSLLERRE